MKQLQKIQSVFKGIQQYLYRSILFTAVICLTTFTWAQESSLPNALLWKISGDQLSSSSYIFGTIHLKDKSVFQFSDSVLPRLEACEVYAPEMDLAPEKIAPLYSKLLLPEDSTLTDIFTPDEYRMIGDVLKKKTGMDISFFNKMRPIALMMLAMNSQLPDEEKFTFDEFLYLKAIAQHKTIEGIETPEEQFDLLGEITKEDILDYFRHPGQKEDMEKMVVLYRQGKLDSLLTEMQNDTLNIDFQKNFITTRNYRMAFRIDTLIQRHTAFIAIGAGHLPGKEGVIGLLEKKGYRVKPVFVISF